MRDVWVGRLDAPPVPLQPIEIVERKGTGHPDSVCDGVMEAVQCSQIGQPIDQPRTAAAQLVLAPSRRLEDVQPGVTAIIEDELAGIGRLVEDLTAGRYRVY